ncbi:MAG: GMC family oxidoreductase [Myxococcales bacterium]|nr:GMC family oxidoreductase [Myxococcales bacterium]
MRGLDDVADFVIVGTGAGGATAARVLAAAGHDVLLLEEGPRLRTAERPRELLGAMGQAFRDAGSHTTRSLGPFPILQGRCVGGATAINSGIVWRMPPWVRADWVAQHGLGALVGGEALDRAYEQIEREIEVEATDPSIWGGNSTLMHEAAMAMGLPGKAMRRNAGRCQASAQCLQGCPGERRQSMDVSYIPRALGDGARLHTGARVDRVMLEFGRAIGVEGALIDPMTHRVLGPLRVMARRAVIVAASTIQTPVILRRSGLRGLVGRRLQMHPGAAVVGRFDEPVAMGWGATQGYEVPLPDRRLKLESLTLPPEMLAARLPGAGASWQTRLTELQHYAQWATIVRMEAHGRVRPTFMGGGSDAAVTFEPTRRDMLRMRDGLATLARMLFTAGAREVFPGIGGLTPVMRSIDEVSLIEETELNPGRLLMTASHLFGTAAAGEGGAPSVVDASLKVRDLSGLYVMDSSVFPTNLGVNPQHTIMALVWVAASRLAEGRG